MTWKDDVFPPIRPMWFKVKELDPKENIYREKIREFHKLKRNSEIIAISYDKRFGQPPPQRKPRKKKENNDQTPLDNSIVKLKPLAIKSTKPSHVK